LSYKIFAFIFIVFSLGGCSEPPPSRKEAESAVDPLLQERLAKDAAFKSSEDSPITKQDRPDFEGLSYYPIDSDFRFRVELHRYERPEQIRLGTNTGEIRSGLRYGYFDFQVDGVSCRLSVYKLEDSVDRGAFLFIPFRDATSGRETYGAGRYIDLKENTSGTYDLDFNRAYNPYCAYNKEFSCPLPPSENTLAVPVYAGEKDYPGSRQ
jgi:uncharacterized protein (DUF1684 family)